MQKPTLQNVRVRSTRDALSIFTGVATGTLPLITRRLDIDERSQIVSGNCYIWEQRSTLEATGLGMERWTDGMGWSPSRVRDDFLFYQQKETQESDTALTPWAQILSHHSTPRTTEAERLIKQTYSVLVTLPEDRTASSGRKWHLTAYYCASTVDTLRVVDDIPDIHGIVIPDGWFQSARTVKGRRERSKSTSGSRGLVHSRVSDEHHAKIGHPDNSKSAGPSYHGFPAPYAIRPHPAPPHNTSRTTVGMNPITTAQPYPRPAIPRTNSHSAAPFAQQSTFARQRSPPSPTPSDHSHDSRDSISSMGTDADTANAPMVNAGLLAGDRSARLVPLMYLQNIAYPKREPADEQFLRLFSV